MSWLSTGRNRARFPAVEQVSRRQSFLSQHRFRHIAAPALEIVREVFNHVGELQPFPETHADLGHAPDVPGSEAAAVRAHEIGPEFADTAGHVVGVLVEIIERLQRRQLSGGSSRKDRQIHFHSLYERRHEPLDAAAVFRRKVLKHREALFQSLEQLPFSRIVLRRSDGRLNVTDLCS